MKMDDAMDYRILVDEPYTGRHDCISTVQQICTLYTLSGLEGAQNGHYHDELFGVLQTATEQSAGMQIRLSAYLSEKSSYSWVLGEGETGGVPNPL